MSLFTRIVASTVKMVFVPVAVVKDIANVATGNLPNATVKTITSAIDDIKQGTSEAIEGDFF